MVFGRFVEWIKEGDPKYLDAKKQAETSAEAEKKRVALQASLAEVRSQIKLSETYIANVGDFTSASGFTDPLDHLADSHPKTSLAEEQKRLNLLKLKESELLSLLEKNS